MGETFRVWLFKHQPMKTEIKIRIKNLFAKAVNNGMTSKQARKFFNNTINEFTGESPKQKKSIATTTDS